MVTAFPVETVPLAALRPHPRNYRGHPDDQLAHLKASLQAHGFYRNVVIARDGTILAGHGIVAAARELGLTEAPAHRLDLDPQEPRALKVLAADNTVSHLAEDDDRALTELLKAIKDTDLDGLLGTGYDEAMLANLVMVTRPADEIRDHDAAAHWVGMPDYDEGGEDSYKVTVNCRTEEEREAWARQAGLTFIKQERRNWIAWYPPKEREDLASLRFQGAA